MSVLCSVDSTYMVSEKVGMGLESRLTMIPKRIWAMMQTEVSVIAA